MVEWQGSFRLIGGTERNERNGWNDDDIMSRAKAAADGVRTNLAAAHDLIAEARLPFIRKELEKRAHAMGCLADRHPASHGYRVEATAYAKSLAVLNASPEAKAARIARRSRIKRALSGLPR